MGADRTGRARARTATFGQDVVDSWSPQCSAHRARWCRRRPSPTCCGPPPAARGHDRTVPALRPERHRRGARRRGSACGGHRCRAVARGTTRCSWPGASSARRDPAPVQPGRCGGRVPTTGPSGPKRCWHRHCTPPRSTGPSLATVLSWIDRRNAATALGILDRNGATRPGDLLAGIAATDPREQSGIWSTASGVLAAYRSEAALATHGGPGLRRRGLLRLVGHAVYLRHGPAPGAWPRPWSWGCSPTSAAAAYARSAGAADGAGGRPRPGRARPGRGGQHRPHPRPARPW